MSKKSKKSKCRKTWEKLPEDLRERLDWESFRAGWIAAARNIPRPAPKPRIFPDPRFRPWCLAAKIRSTLARDMK